MPRVPDHFLPELPAGSPETMIGVVLERSRRLCLQQYRKELLTPTTYLEAYSRGGERSADSSCQSLQVTCMLSHMHCPPPLL